MDYPQPLSAPTASTYPAAHSGTPLVSQERESVYQPEQTGSVFSVGDAAWVVMRSLSTAAECLNFVCRKVVVLSSVCFGGFIGLLQYAHENLGNRTAQQVPAREKNRIGQQSLSQLTDKKLTDEKPTDTEPIQQTTYLQNPPVEEYVRQGASRWKHFVESSTTPGSEYSWMYLVSMVISVTLSVYVLGVVGAIILHTPDWLFKAEPYIYLNKPTSPESLSRSASTLPLSHQDPQMPPLDPEVERPARDNPACQPALPPTKPLTAVTSTKESSQESQCSPSTSAVDTGNKNQSPQLPPKPTNQHGTASEPLTTNAQTTQQPATSPVSFSQANHLSSVQHPVQKRLHSCILTPAGDDIPTSVPVHQFCR